MGGGVAQAEGTSALSTGPAGPAGRRRAPFGTWESPVGPEALVAGALGLGFPRARGTGVVWQEARPEEGGRVALVAAEVRSGGLVGERELLPAGASARTGVHEYGGRAWALTPPGDLVSSFGSDQRLWSVRADRSGPVPLTPEPVPARSVRFACPCAHPDGQWAVAVRERHLAASVVNDLVAVPLPGGGEPTVLATGHDFYSSPTFSPDGARLAFVCWDQPHMPWDATQLVVGEFADGSLRDLRTVAGGASGRAESVLQPSWSPEGELCYVSDRTGWWNLYLQDRPLAPMEAEFAGPAWAFGDSDHAWLEDGRLVATWSARGRSYLGLVEEGRARPFELEETQFSHLSPVGAGWPLGPGVLAVSGGPRAPRRLAHFGPEGQVTTLKWSAPRALADEWVSLGRHFSFPTTGGATAHAVFYPPTNPLFEGPVDQAPPLVLTSHGGPTGASSSALELRAQYWTTRGFAVVDVDYRGSTGYGRAYRDALEGGWGVLDVDDCLAAVAAVGKAGWADVARALARGSSASGLTVLAVLARGGAAAGAVRYPVCDLATLVDGAPKFESGYLSRLVPTSAAAQRSPLGLAASVHVPVLILHGLQDSVVPAAQSVAMAAELRRAGNPAALVLLDGEGHGFRQSWALVRAQELELAFYLETLGLAGTGDRTPSALAELAAARGPDGVTWSGPADGQGQGG